MNRRDILKRAGALALVGAVPALAVKEAEAAVPVKTIEGPFLNSINVNSAPKKKLPILQFVRKKIKVGPDSWITFYKPIHGEISRSHPHLDDPNLTYFSLNMRNDEDIKDATYVYHGGFTLPNEYKDDLAAINFKIDQEIVRIVGGNKAADYFSSVIETDRNRKWLEENYIGPR